MNIEKAILDECHKLIHRQQKLVAQNNAHRRRFEKATGRSGGQPSHIPPYWGAADVFNPFKVRRHAELIARSLIHQLDRGEYRPRPALVLEKDKPDGSKRPLSIFPVADAGLATICFRRIAERNQHRLSPYSYAFRRDIGVHEAIESLKRELAQRHRFWIVEFDFSKYFDTISHTYIRATIDRHFRITETEHRIINGLLESRRAFGVDSYQAGLFRPLTHGIPQGNSLSLFLANAACHELDLSLARTSARFSRYADDILLVCETRGDADRVSELIMEHCSRSGLAINFEKSQGIRQFGPECTSPKSQSLPTIEYLGYAFSYRQVAKRGSPARSIARRLSIRQRTLKKIKNKVGNIIFCHLLKHPDSGNVCPRRIDLQAGIDWDVVTCINDLRSYIYGDIPEDDIRDALGDRNKQLHMSRGVLSFYPLVDDAEQMKSLDGWLVNALSQAVCKRHAKLAQLGISAPRLDRTALLGANWYDATKITPRAIENDVRIPSFIRSWKYSRRCLNAFNLSEFPFTDIVS